MITLEQSRLPVDRKALMKKSALEKDTSRVVSQPCIVTENGKPLIVYGKLGYMPVDLDRLCQKIKFQTTTRTGGLKSTSRIFGFRPRNVIRNDYCSSTSLAMEDGISHSRLCYLATEMNRLYQEFFPEQFKNHEKTVSSVLPEWRIPGTVFTSGIINFNNTLKYHQDAGNFKDCLSAMITVKKSISGGMLSIPELDLKFDLQSSTYIIFNGQELLHGVTPIFQDKPDGYRYTIVYYALQQLCHCLPFDEELKRIRKIKKSREEKRVQKP